MIYKRLKLLLLTSSMVLFVFAPTVLAADTADTGTSDVTIEFTAGTGEGGPLTLDYVSSFEFAVQEVSGSDEIYQTTTLDPYIQITDRRGTGAGWNVIAQVSNFMRGTEVSLPGAVITLNNGTAEGNIYSSEPVPQRPVVLNPGGEASKVIIAGENAGMGTWKNKWSPTNVTLDIPAGSATVGNHTSTITWTLQDAPI